MVINYSKKRGASLPQWHSLRKRRFDFRKRHLQNVRITRPVNKNKIEVLVKRNAKNYPTIEIYVALSSLFSIAIHSNSIRRETRVLSCHKVLCSKSNEQRKNSYNIFLSRCCKTPLDNLHPIGGQSIAEVLAWRKMSGCNDCANLVCYTYI